ncbi:orotidine-5'-phosphate decarboxylase [Bartonella sp. DGB1]|uniref:orotidine-5'-phosphate decarboxylase n=1 Tax=Bartonella sp. DGB1 TaxID=3239807 RepID=UPI003523A0BA
MRMKDKLIVGLDVENVNQAQTLVSKLGDEVNFYKIGYQLAFAGGLDFARELIADGKKIFLDMKLLDIGNTITHAVENIAKMGVDMLTIHAYPEAMRAAVTAAKNSNICLLGVTVLTSMDDQDLANAGYGEGVTTLVVRRALQAKDIGMGGIVTSALEVQHIRHLIGQNMVIVTPGVRLENSDKDDQKRVLTPRKAVESGANYIVMARPIIKAEDPIEVVKLVKKDMQLAKSE